MAIFSLLIGPLMGAIMVTLMLAPCFRRFSSGIALFVLLNMTSLAIIGVMAGFGSADGRGFNEFAWIGYVPAHLVSFGLMLFGHFRKSRTDR